MNASFALRVLTKLHQVANPALQVTHAQKVLLLNVWPELTLLAVKENAQHAPLAHSLPYQVKKNAKL